VGPMLVGRSSDTYQLSHPFRHPLHFIVTTVMVVTLPLFKGSCVTVPMWNPRDRYPVVTVSSLRKWLRQADSSPR